MTEKLREKNIAIVLAAGRGKRMNSDRPKQFLDLNGHPVVWYSLRAFQESKAVDHIVLVTGEDYVDGCRMAFGPGCQYAFSKLSAVVSGGEERYDSVMAGLNAIAHDAGMQDCDYVLIHDGARPLIDEDLILRCLSCAREHGAAAAGMPSKDTIKICDSDRKVTQTPDRSKVWLIQTPQAFRYTLITQAYREAVTRGLSGITDDAMVAERAGFPVYLCEGAYRNIKITTPEDLIYAQALMKSSI